MGRNDRENHYLRSEEIKREGAQTQLRLTHGETDTVTSMGGSTTPARASHRHLIFAKPRAVAVEIFSGTLISRGKAAARGFCALHERLLRQDIRPPRTETRASDADGPGPPVKLGAARARVGAGPRARGGVAKTTIKLRLFAARARRRTRGGPCRGTGRRRRRAR